MEVTRWPQCFKMTPMLLAVTPLPSPLTTPPDTSTYFMLCYAHTEGRRPECCLRVALLDGAGAAAAQTQQGCKPHSMLRSTFLPYAVLPFFPDILSLFNVGEPQVVLRAQFEREEASTRASKGYREPAAG